ncbi:MAG: hypothetical protein QG662_2204 [Pseudomonadota bacterium]|nr:hypothetical protein [Pseudomonadota bacterium]
MKFGLVALPLLLCVVGVAMADGVDREAPADPAQPVAVRGKIREQAQEPAPARRTARLPQGDLRRCLDLQTNEAIIRCSETRRKR